MNKFFAAVLLAASLLASEEVKVQEVQGLQERIKEGKLHLRLRDFLELVLKNSTDIRISRLDINLAENRITASKSPFDPQPTLGFNTLRTLNPPSFYYSQQTLSSLSTQANIGYTQLLPTGQTVGGTLNVGRFSGQGYLTPALFGSLNFSVTQPLLRNRRNIEFRAPMVIAREQLQITSRLTEAAIGRDLAEAARQYWQAVQARDAIQVQEQSLDLARKAYERDKRALDLGAIAKLDIYQSETQVAERTRDLIQARYQYKAALDGLRTLIGADLTPEIRGTEIVLEDDPSALPERAGILPFEEALSKAMGTRPEMKAADGRISIDQWNARVARETLLPRVDLTLNGGSSGPALGLATYPGLPETLRQVLAFNYPSYGFGVQMTLPFRNSAGRANLADAAVGKARDAYSQRQTKEQIVLDVRQAINAIELASATVEAATKARDLAQKNVEAEQQKYELGTITAFEFLDSQTRLSATQTSLLGAYVGYQQAYVNYQRATWTLLENYGMIVR